MNDLHANSPMQIYNDRSHEIGGGSLPRAGRDHRGTQNVLADYGPSARRQLELGQFVRIKPEIVIGVYGKNRQEDETDVGGRRTLQKQQRLGSGYLQKKKGMMIFKARKTKWEGIEILGAAVQFSKKLGK